MSEFEVAEDPMLAAGSRKTNLVEYALAGLSRKGIKFIVISLLGIYYRVINATQLWS